MTLPELHERLLSWASADPHDPLLLAARKAHFDRYGEPHEEDLSFERRMNGMLDFYLFDFRPDPAGPTALERFLEAHGGALQAAEADAFRALGANRHGLFEVRKLKPGLVRLRDVFEGEDVDVTERRQVAGLEKGDLLEARLMPYDGQLFFSGAFLYQPREARSKILAEVKKRKKAAAKGLAELDVPGLLATLSRMAFKLERYRNVRLESIYDFTVDSRAMTPRPART
ncbi:MAG TPA: hypothetical protein VFP50_02815 [Anaeromyxobacteraceae bacterium]|nr:hypothetical protein [Anaeromyxobacteraceae bacterium]